MTEKNNSSKKINKKLTDKKKFLINKMGLDIDKMEYQEIVLSYTNKPESYY